MARRRCVFGRGLVKISIEDAQRNIAILLRNSLVDT